MWNLFGDYGTDLRQILAKIAKMSSNCVAEPSHCFRSGSLMLSSNTLVSWYTLSYSPVSIVA